MPRPLPDTMDNVLLAVRLKALRDAKRLTQPELAQLTHSLSSTGISHIECGRRVPSTENLYQLCKALQCSADYLLGLRGVAKPRLY